MNPNINWPAFWSEFIGGCLLSTMLLATFAWFVILPTVGLLFCFGVLP